MIRLGAIVWLVLVLAAGFTTFKVKYAVQDIEDELNRVRKQTIAEQQEIRVLTAEWTYLNQPERLADLNRRFLALGPIAAKQPQRTVADVPLRAPAAPDIVVAVDSDSPAPRAAASALPIAPATLAVAVSGPAGPVRLATAGPAQMAASLDALIAQIVEAR